MTDLICCTDSQRTISAISTDDKLRQLYQQNEKLAKEKEDLISSNLKNLVLETGRMNGLLKQIEDQHMR